MKRGEGAVAIDIREPLGSSAWHDEPMAADNFTFFRVPAHIRERNKLLYEPRMVAIGPYGRRDEPSLRAMELLKRRYFQSFRSRSGNRSIEDYVAEIQKLEPRARRCYFEQVELSTVEFVEMLLLDGCFIVEFLIKWNGGDKDGLFAAEWSLPLVRGDLLLLENQIPLFVLDKLFKLIMDSKIPSLMVLLVKYLKVKEESGRSLRDNDFHHLLHVYYDYYVKKPRTDSNEEEEEKQRTDSNEEKKKENQKRWPRTIPSATELLNAGVTIKKKNQNQNSPSPFLDVTFSDGVLEMSLLSVENSTLPLFSNLVAFEQCGGCKLEEAYMTSYAVFMDCLIDTPGDVAVLRERGILENKLASDKELADFFNGLSDWTSLDYDKHYLARLFQDVTDYCGSKWPKWRAKLLTDYFSSPWAIISVIAAAVLLFLTILQTVYIIDTYYHAS